MRKTEEDQGAKLVRCALGIVIGGTSALLTCLIVLLAASLAIAWGLFGDGHMYQVTILGCVLGAFAGGSASVRRCGERSLLAGLAAGAVFFLMLLTTGVLFFRTTSPEGGCVGILCGCLCGGAAAGLLGAGARKDRHKKKNRRK